MKRFLLLLLSLHGLTLLSGCGGGSQRSIFAADDHHRLIVQWHSATGVQPDDRCFVGGVNTLLGSQLVLNTDKRRNIYRGCS